MTEIGRMIRDEAIKEGKAEGIAEGKVEGKAEILIKILMKKFKFIPEEYKNKIKKLDEASIDVIATDIFEIEDLEDLLKYFK